MIELAFLVDFLLMLLVLLLVKLLQLFHLSIKRSEEFSFLVKLLLLKGLSLHHRRHVNLLNPISRSRLLLQPYVHRSVESCQIPLFLALKHQSKFTEILLWLHLLFFLVSFLQWYATHFLSRKTQSLLQLFLLRADLVLSISLNLPLVVKKRLVVVRATRVIHWLECLLVLLLPLFKFFVFLLLLQSLGFFKAFVFLFLLFHSLFNKVFPLKHPRLLFVLDHHKPCYLLFLFHKFTSKQAVAIKHVSSKRSRRWCWEVHRTKALVLDLVSQKTVVVIIASRSTACLRMDRCSTSLLRLIIDPREECCVHRVSTLFVIASNWHTWNSRIRFFVIPWCKLVWLWCLSIWNFLCCNSAADCAYILLSFVSKFLFFLVLFLLLTGSDLVADLGELYLPLLAVKVISHLCNFFAHFALLLKVFLREI